MNKWQRWVQGMKELTPMQVMQSRVFFNIGVGVGEFLGFIVVTFWTGPFWLSIILFCLSCLQGLTVATEFKQISNLKKLEKNMKEMEETMEAENVRL